MREIGILVCWTTIREGRGKTERFQILKEIAEYQLNILNAAKQIKLVE